jgi:hypothetical protein
VHNNIWDTNFPVGQSFEMDFRYRVAASDGDATSLGATTATSLVQPLRAVLAETPDAEAPTSRSLFQVDDPRVQLIGLRHLDDDSILVRLRSNAVSGLAATLTLPDGVARVRASSYLGEPGDEVAIDGGTVPVAFRGSGVQSLILTLH